MTPYCKSALGSSQVHSYTIWSKFVVQNKPYLPNQQCFQQKKKKKNQQC